MCWQCNEVMDLHSGYKMEINAPLFKDAEHICIVVRIDDKELWQLPCGHSLNDLKDVPCPCGDPKHWLVKIDRDIIKKTIGCLIKAI